MYSFSFVFVYSGSSCSLRCHTRWIHSAMLLVTLYSKRPFSGFFVVAGAAKIKRNLHNNLRKLLQKLFKIFKKSSKFRINLSIYCCRGCMKRTLQANLKIYLSTGCPRKNCATKKCPRLVWIKGGLIVTWNTMSQMKSWLFNAVYFSHVQLMTYTRYICLFVAVFVCLQVLFLLFDTIRSCLQGFSSDSATARFDTADTQT